MVYFPKKNKVVKPTKKDDNSGEGVKKSSSETVSKSVAKRRSYQHSNKSED